MLAREDRADQLARLAADLRVALGKLNRRLRAEAGPNELTSAQKVVLVRLERGPASVSDLARQENMRPQSMSATVAALESAGLVAGAPDPDDGRRILFSLTPACTDMLRANRAAREDWLVRALAAKLSPAEQKDVPHLVGLLAKLAD